MMLSRAFTLRCLLSACCVGLAWPATVRAQESATAPVAESLPVALELVSTPLTAKEVESALASELRVPVKVTTRPSPKGLAIAVKWRRATVSFVNDGGEKTTRSINLPADRAQSLEIIALLAGNLARDEAGELLERLTPAEPPPAPPAPPPAETAEPAPEPAEKAVAPTKEKEELPKPPPSKKQGLPPPPKLPPPPAPLPPPDLAKLIRDENASFNLSLWYPTTLLSETDRRVIHGELGLAYSRIGALEGAALTLGYLRVEQQHVGFSSTLGWNRVDGKVLGVQMAAIGTEGHGNLRGYETSSLLALRWGKVEGAQTATLFARAEDVIGLQASAVAARARDVQGVQASSVAVSRDFMGIQAGVVAASNDIQGVQAGVVSMARDVKGFQASVVGAARDVDGVQAGVVNVAKSAEMQIGVVNVAERIDVASLGVVSIAGNGRVQPFVMAGYLPDASVNVGVRFVAGYGFTQFAFGQELDETRFRIEGGGGFHYEVERDDIGVEAVAAELSGHYSNTYQGDHTFEGDQVGRVHYRLGAHVMVVKPAWIMGGIELSHRVPVEGDAAFGGWIGASLF
jgi:hypothetical protein